VLGGITNKTVNNEFAQWQTVRNIEDLEDTKPTVSQWKQSLCAYCPQLSRFEINN